MRLIDSDALVKWLMLPDGFLSKCEDCYGYGGYHCVACIAEFAVKNAPTIVPITYGKWVKTKLGKEACSVCGGRTYFDCDEEQYIRFDFCPHCGARMG